MITDVTGIKIIPGNYGCDCPGNGRDPETECCCEECDYMVCCLQNPELLKCSECKDEDCPRRKVAYGNRTI